ncbi:MAG: L-lysine 6-transaminase [Deltaproteobacteria bacterium]|nr:L-lysine 6-transaminase [Deltaproteobacteria bacterium]
MKDFDIPPSRVRSTLAKHIIVDGFHLVVDLGKSKGSYMVCSDTGKKYLDMYSYFSTCPLGHNHPGFMTKEFQRDLREAAIENPANSDIYTEQYADFVDAFATLAKPSYMKHMFFIAGGALSVENAMKTAFDWKVQKNFQKGSKKELGSQVIHFRKAFHGRSGYTLSVTNTSPIKTRYFPKFKWPRVHNPKLTFPVTPKVLSDVKKQEAKSLSQIKDAIKKKGKDIACLLIEPIQGEGGDNHFRPEFLQSLESICKKNDIMFILDEVQTGFGTTGKMWAFEHFGIKPDIVAFGKKSQVCGIMCSKRVDEVKDNVFRVSSRINSTWGGNLVDMVKSKRILEIMVKDDVIQNAATMGKYFMKRLEELQTIYPEITNIRGRGLFIAMDLPDPEERKILLNKCWRNGLAVLSCGERSIRFRPPLTISRNDIDRAIELLEKSIKLAGLKNYHEFYHHL